MCDVCNNPEGKTIEFGIFNQIEKTHTEVSGGLRTVIKTTTQKDFSPGPGEPFHQMTFCDNCIFNRTKSKKRMYIAGIVALLMATAIFIILELVNKGDNNVFWILALIFGFFCFILLVIRLLEDFPLYELFNAELIAYAKERDRNVFAEAGKYKYILKCHLLRL